MRMDSSDDNSSVKENDSISVNADGLKTYTLKKPITMGADTIHELTFMEPNVALLKRMDGTTGEMGKAAKMIEVICNLTPKAVDQISIYDLKQINEILSSFLPE